MSCPECFGSGLIRQDCDAKWCAACDGTGKQGVSDLLARLECAEAGFREAAGQIDEMRAQLLDCQRRIQALETENADLQMLVRHGCTEGEVARIDAACRAAEARFR